MPRFNIYNRRRSSKGQTLIIAIMVMFILAIVATVFIALIARNLFRAGRFSSVDAVAQYAEAGVQYADKMLTSSEAGADWRPEPDNLGQDGPLVYPNQPNPIAGWASLRDRNPDFKWVRPYWHEELPSGSPEGTGYAGPSGGFTTYNTGDGRFLLRVSYGPNPNDPLSKFIKIETVGRWGTIENDDPTTWASAGNVNLRREITAFKPIGVTDYLRFVTNKDNRSADIPLGCPGFQFSLGRSDSDKIGFRGAPIRVNGNLIWQAANGSNSTAAVALYLRRAIDGDGKNIPIDRVEVAGDIKVADPSLQIEVHEMNDSGRDENTTTVTVSDDTSNFNTVGGLYRDGRDEVDKFSYARGVKRIEPPLIDQTDPTESTTRYRLLSLNSGERTKVGSIWRNLGQLGWGRGVYINNIKDVQSESETLVGGYTLRADWIKPNSPMSTYWKGPFYIPPGAVITLNPGDTDGDKQDDFTITRTDISSRGRTAVWYDAWGYAKPEWGQTITMPYPKENGGRIIYQRNADGSWDMDESTAKKLEGNGVIYAEGNIRIRGMLPKNTQITVVSNENIYIEGNLLKNRQKKSRNDGPWRGADNSCGLALLARKNVIVNTTMFFAPMNSLSADDVGSDGMNGLPPYHVIVNSSPESQLRCMFDMGPWESSTSTMNPYSHGQGCFLYLRHSGQYGPAYINAWMNPSSSGLDWGILKLNPGIVANLPPYVYGVGVPPFNPAGWGIGSSFAGDVFRLSTTINAYWADWNSGDPITMGVPNLIQLGLDQSTYVRSNYQMGGIAIQPMDIRIEALLYAQDGSFFVIPGNWFNPNPDDTPGKQRPDGVKPQFPYFGQPLDVRIIVDGAVTENLPAAVGDVEEWMSKWGKIPDKYGSSDISTAHPGEGLTILYDDHVGWPLSNLGSGGAGTPIRWDSYGRPLPIVPRLPVSGSLVYFGDVM